MREAYVLSLLAQEDREKIFREIAEDDVDTALRVDGELEKVLLRLAHTRTLVTDEPTFFLPASVFGLSIPSW